MLRNWNYILYSTWKLLSLINIKLIEKPLFGILSIVPFFNKRIKNGKGAHRKVLDDKIIGFNIAYAKSCMFFSTILIYTILSLYIVHFLEFEVRDNLKYWFIIVIVLTYLTNQTLSLGNDKYLKYFAEFDNLSNGEPIYLLAILFHLSILIFTSISIHLTVGYNL